MNFRRVFEERAYDVHGHVVAREDFRLFSDREGGFTVCEEHLEKIIRQAEDLLSVSYEPLIATDYMMFRRDGNRSVYEGKYFKRRRNLLALCLAEYVEDRGRFTDAIVDLLWAILEETTWVVPAHNPARDGVPMCLPYAFAQRVEYIDLFAATTAADLSFVYALMKDKLNAVTPLLCERLLYELDRRIVRPFTDRELLKSMWWSGLSNRKVNNWNPWIISNILTTCALTVADLAVREEMTSIAMELLNSFTQVYHDDGGCDEGPSYWGAAGGALYDACCLLYDLTDGYVNVFDDELIRRMGEYKVNVFIGGNRFLNFADSPAKLSLTPALLFDWGTRCGSERMISAGLFGLNGELPSPSLSDFHPYRSFRQLTLTRQSASEFLAPTRLYLDGIGIAVSRESEHTDEGLYLAFKGGHNGESHNHNDIGTVTVFSGHTPIFLDAGSGTYTKRTFSSERYTIWSMRSDYHNVATVNHCLQSVGTDACSCQHIYDESTGSLSMELKHAYPTEAGISSYTRQATMKDRTIIICDTLRFEKPGVVDFHFLLNTMPEHLTDNSFTVHGRTVTFDPTLTLRYELADHTQPETSNIAPLWDCESLVRVTLSATEPFLSHTFTLCIQ